MTPPIKSVLFAIRPFVSLSFAVLFFAGCASVKSPPTIYAKDADKKYSVAPSECNSTTTSVSNSIVCAEKMSENYDLARLAVMREEKSVGLGLVGLGVAAAGIATFESDKDAARSLGILGAALTGTNLYLSPKKVAEIYGRAAVQMACVADEARKLQVASESHVKNMMSMVVAYDIAYDSDSGLAEAEKLGEEGREYVESVYDACANTSATRLVGGYSEIKKVLESKTPDSDSSTLAATSIESNPTVNARILRVIRKIDSAVKTGVLTSATLPANPQATALATLKTYFAEQATQENMKDAVANAPETASKATPPNKKEVAAAELVESAKDALESGTKTDQAAATLEACATL
jgi:hypothetical protein